jgi:hypothetical protein
MPGWSIALIDAELIHCWSLVMPDFSRASLALARAKLAHSRFIQRFSNADFCMTDPDLVSVSTQLFRLNCRKLIKFS